MEINIQLKILKEELLMLKIKVGGLVAVVVDKKILLLIQKAKENTVELMIFHLLLQGPQIKKQICKKRILI